MMRAHKEFADSAGRSPAASSGMSSNSESAAIASTAYYVLHASHFVSTDNAYAAVEVAQVTPSIGGTVSEVLVTGRVKVETVGAAVSGRVMTTAALRAAETLPAASLAQA